VAPGALIGPGTTVATFFSNQRNVIAKVSEEDVGKVKVGQPAKVHLLNLGDETLDAKVSTILPFADADTQRYSVYLDVAAEPKKLKPFATGEVSITVGEHPNQPRIPRRAVFNDDYVFVVKGGVVEKRKVKLGFRALNFAEVVENLAPGEQVIVDDLDQFRDGQHVKVVEAKAGI
jgi:RND family efflux transporter MFP subunit